MFGLWFSLLGLLSAFLCSFNAKKRKRSQKDWFTLGFLLPGASFVILYLLPMGANDHMQAEKLWR
jgi:hypothetical protein